MLNTVGKELLISLNNAISGYIASGSVVRF